MFIPTNNCTNITVGCDDLGALYGKALYHVNA